MNDVRDIKWSTQRPTVPGAYWVRGFCLDSGKERQAALVEVCESEHGLICNLHEPNSERPGKFHSWHEVSECHESFEWSQPLLPASPCPHIATSREGTSYCRLAESDAMNMEKVLDLVQSVDDLLGALNKPWDEKRIDLVLALDDMKTARAALTQPEKSP